MQFDQSSHTATSKRSKKEGVRSFHTLGIKKIVAFLAMAAIIGLASIGANLVQFAFAQTGGSPGSSVLSGTTTFKTYNVQLSMTPGVNGDVNSTSFQVRFTDHAGNAVSAPVKYDFSVTDRFLTSIAEMDNQTTDSSGVGMPLVIKFDHPGEVEITVWVSSINATGQSTRESATFNTTVVPEFPETIPILGLTGGIMFAIYVSKKKLIF